MVLNICQAIAFGITGLWCYSVAGPDIASCPNASYETMFLGLGITFILMAGVATLNFPFACKSRGYEREGCSNLIGKIATFVSMAGGIVVFVLAIIGSVHTWQPGWADYTCMRTALWAHSHAYYMALWISSGAVCVLACFVTCACACCAAVAARSNE